MLFFQLYIPMVLNGLTTLHKLNFVLKIHLINFQTLQYIFNHFLKLERVQLRTGLILIKALNSPMFIWFLKSNHICLKKRNSLTTAFEIRMEKIEVHKFSAVQRVEI